MSLSNGKETIDNRSFGRRAFLKGTAAALGLAAVSGTGCAPKPEIEKADDRPEPPEEQIYQGVCRGNCGGGCRMNVHVREGKVVKTSVIEADDPHETFICQRGLSHAQRIYAPERVQYPMRRVEGTPRGGGEWERLTWDEAIDYICTKWKGYIEEHGSSSVSYGYGAGTYALNYFVYMRLFNLLGGTNFGQEYDMAALEMDWRIFGNPTFKIGNSTLDILNAKYIFVWGFNGTVCKPGWHLRNEAMEENGAKLIVIDPVYTDAAKKADLWVPIKPGTDNALALAMMNTFVAEGLQDSDFLAKYTVAPFLVKEENNKFMRLSDLGVEPTEGPINPRTGKPTVIDPPVVIGTDGAHGTLEEISDPVITGSFTIEDIAVTTAYDLLVERIAEWTPEKAAELCDIPADTIKELARMYAEGPTTLEVGFGNDHWGNGASTTHCHLTLPLITGQVGKPGAGMGGQQTSSGGGNPATNLGPAIFPEGAVGGLASCLLYLPQIMETGTYGDKDLMIKSYLNVASNPLASHCDRNALKKAFDKIELFINVDTIMNDTSRYADVVLPIPHWYEYETASATPTDYCDFNDKSIEPQFECKTDIEIARLLGLGMGLEAMDISNDEFHSMILDNDAARSYGLSWENLKKEKHIRVRPKEWLYGRDENPFATATGRAEFFIEDVAPRYNYGQQIDTKLYSLPCYEPPLEAWEDNPIIEKYPLTLMTHRDKFKVHTSFAPMPWFTEIQPEPTVQLNPADAEARGIVDGDYVKLFNDRGFVVMRAYLDAGMRPGCTWTEHTWLDDQYVEGHYSELTSIATRHYKPSNHPFDTLCQIEKA